MVWELYVAYLAVHPTVHTKHWGKVTDRQGRTKNPVLASSLRVLRATYLTAWGKVFALS